MIDSINLMQPISQFVGPANIPIPGVLSLGDGIMVSQTPIFPIIPPNNIANTNNVFFSFGAGSIS